MAGLLPLAIMGGNPEKKIMERAVFPVARAASLIDDGKIIALKGVGGYNFVCSPFDENAVRSLRRLKIREEKPFAVMFRDLEQIREYCHANEEEERLLQSSAKPIVLLERKQQTDGCDNNKALENSTEQKERKIICSDVYKTSRFIGAFLPSMGLQHMLINLCGPLIVTSANLSDMPIIKDDEEMFSLQDTLAPKNMAPEGAEYQPEREESEMLSSVFYNERKIRIRLDDSVVRVIDGQPQMIRRSKGYAPVPLYINNRLNKKDMILATGGQLKASFSLSKGPFAYVSQYFGDLDSRESGQIYEENILRMKELFRIKPKLVVSDLHPLYFTTKYAEEYSRQHNIEHLKIQHHHAHVASVMAEHDLQEPVIGVSFDGTGYGTDGAIWGGEFLVCQETDFQRIGHLEYVKMLGGDSSMKEGWKSAFSYLYHYRMEDEAEGKEDMLWQPDDVRWLTVKAGLQHNINTIHSSSMGRLFDGITAFTGIHDYNRYEGECAIMLENAAAEAICKGLEPWEMHFDISRDFLISAKQIFYRAEEALLSGIDKGSDCAGIPIMQYRK